MKYIPLVALSAFLFACSQESSTGTEASIIEEQLQNGSTALVEEASDSEGEFALLKKTYKIDTFPSEKTVTQFPVRMKLKVERVPLTGPNIPRSRYSRTTSISLVYDKNSTDSTKYEYYSMKHKGVTLAVNKTKFTWNGSHVNLPNSTNDYAFCEKSTVNTSYQQCTSLGNVQSVKLADFAVIAAYVFVHGKDTVYMTAGDNIDNSLASAVYNDILLPKLNNLQ